MAVHLRLELFSKSRSHDLRGRLLKAISKIMKHATEQLNGGEIREQLDSLFCARSQSDSTITTAIPTTTILSVTTPKPEHEINPTNNRNDDDDDDAKHEGNNSNHIPLLSSSKFYDIKSDFSCIIHVSESISSEYQFAAIQNQQVFFDVVDISSSSLSSLSSSSLDTKFKFYRQQALQMLNQIIFEELFISSSLPRANKDDFSFYDFIPALENTIVACVERIANWCSVLYGFSLTFGNPLWNRTVIDVMMKKNLNEKTENIIILSRPPVFSNCVTFLFESPRNGASSGPIISLFIQITLKSHNNQHQHQNGNDIENNNNNTISSTSRNITSQISPTVNIISSQLERNGQPLMFSWVPAANNNNTNTIMNENYEAMAGAVLQYLVDSIPKLQGLYRSMLHHQNQHQNQHQQQKY